MQKQDAGSRPEQTSHVTAVNSSNWRSTIIAIVITALVTGTGGYLLGARTSQNVHMDTQRVSFQPSPTTTPVSAPSPSPTRAMVTMGWGEWKTYTNKKCKYQVKYPSEWYLSPEQEDALYGIATISSHDDDMSFSYKNPTPASKERLKVEIGCGALDTNKTPRQWIDEFNNRDDGYGVPKIENLQQITVQGSLAYRQIVVSEIQTVEGQTIQYKTLQYFIFPTNDRVLGISFSLSDTTKTRTIDQILSTLRFMQ